MNAATAALTARKNTATFPLWRKNRCASSGNDVVDSSVSMVVLQECSAGLLSPPVNRLGSSSELKHPVRGRESRALENRLVPRRSTRHGGPTGKEDAELG